MVLGSPSYLGTYDVLTVIPGFGCNRWSPLCDLHGSWNRDVTEPGVSRVWGGWRAEKSGDDKLRREGAMDGGKWNHGIGDRTPCPGGLSPVGGVFFRVPPTLGHRESCGSPWGGSSRCEAMARMAGQAATGCFDCRMTCSESHPRGDLRGPTGTTATRRSRKDCLGSKGRERPAGRLSWARRHLPGSASAPGAQGGIVQSHAETLSIAPRLQVRRPRVRRAP